MDIYKMKIHKTIHWKKKHYISGEFQIYNFFILIERKSIIHTLKKNFLIIRLTFKNTKVWIFIK
jgi:hypothetical protein